MKDWLHGGYAKDRWRSVAGETEEYYASEDTDRDGLLREPNVAALAELFRRCREKNETLARTLVSRSTDAPEASISSTPAAGSQVALSRMTTHEARTPTPSYTSRS